MADLLDVYDRLSSFLWRLRMWPEQKRGSGRRLPVLMFSSLSNWEGTLAESVLVGGDTDLGDASFTFASSISAFIVISIFAELRYTAPASSVLHWKTRWLMPRRHLWTIVFIWSCPTHPWCQNKLRGACWESFSRLPSATDRKGIFNDIFDHRVNSCAFFVARALPSGVQEVGHERWYFLPDHLLCRAGDLCSNYWFNFEVIWDDFVDLWGSFRHHCSFALLYIWACPVLVVLTTLSV